MSNPAEPNNTYDIHKSHNKKCRIQYSAESRYALDEIACDVNSTRLADFSPKGAADQQPTKNEEHHNRLMGEP